MPTRRAMLATPFALAATAAASTARPPLPGLQLFAVSDALAQDPAATLARVAALGFRAVETVGAFGGDPARWRSALRRAGLHSPAQHIMPRALAASFARRRTLPPGALKAAWLRAFSAEGLDATIDESIASAKSLGQRYIVWQMLWPEQIADAAAVRETCRLLDRAADRCGAAGLRFAFHNQESELVGDRAFDRIVEGTKRHVLLELDLGAALRAGRDPAALLQVAPERVHLAHVRDAGAAMSLPAMLRLVAATAVRHVFLDYERLPDPFAQLAADRRALLQEYGS